MANRRSETSQEDRSLSPGSDDKGDQKKKGTGTSTLSPPGSPPLNLPPVPAPTAQVVRNPFRHRLQPNSPTRIRQHFPVFDRAILVGNEDTPRSPSPSSSSTVSPNHASHILNRSNASSSAAGGSSHASSTLNMSIGARAALNEHLRHIARFGLDGLDNHHDNEGGSSIGNHNHDDNIQRRGSNSNSPLHGIGEGRGQAYTTSDDNRQKGRSITPPRNPLDAIWDKLLDGAHLSPASSSSSSQNAARAATSPGALKIDTVVSVSSGEIEGTEAIEVSPKVAAKAAKPASSTQHNNPQEEQQQQQRLPPISLFPWDHHNHHLDYPVTDYDNQSKSSKSSSSFFNSSRVYQLRTPERNYATDTADADQGVTQRHVDYAPTSPSILEESTICGSDAGGGIDSIPMAHMFHALTAGAMARRTTTSPNASHTSPLPTPSQSQSPLDHSFASFVVGAADLSRISGYGASPDNSFQRDTSFQQQHLHNHLHPHQRPLFSSWDDEDDDVMPLHHHLPFDNPFLEGPSPPPQPSRSTSQGVFYPTQQPQRDTSWSSLPTPRLHHQQRSLSPPKRRPLLQKQHSCPVSGSGGNDILDNRYYPSQQQKPRSSATKPVFSEAAQKAGWMALTQEREQQEQGVSAPTHTLVDFFQDYSLPANDSSSNGTDNMASRHQHHLPHDHTNLLFQAPDFDIHTQQASVDDISTILNDSSSGGQHNISSSSSSNNKQWRMAKSIGGKGEQQQQHKKSAVATTPATAVLNRSTLSSSSSSSVILPVDRRRYRTVVPSRVFLKEEPKAGFPVARDSFSSDDPGKKVPGRSSSGNSRQQQDEDEESCLLQDSFEAAHQLSLLEESQKQQQQQQQQQH